MPDFMISFRIAETRDYDTRYENFVAKVEHAGTKYWDETTSFYLLRSAKSIAELGGALIQALDSDWDFLLIREIGVNRTRYAGPIADMDFFEFFPDAKKL